MSSFNPHYVEVLILPALHHHRISPRTNESFIPWHYVHIGYLILCTSPAVAGAHTRLLQHPWAGGNISEETTPETSQQLGTGLWKVSSIPIYGRGCLGKVTEAGGKHGGEVIDLLRC